MLQEAVMAETDIEPSITLIILRISTLSIKPFITSRNQYNYNKILNMEFVNWLLLLKKQRKDSCSVMPQFDTMLSVSFTKPSPVQSLSDCKPFLTAFLWRIASCCRCTKSVWVVKNWREYLKSSEKTMKTCNDSYSLV